MTIFMVWVIESFGKFCWTHCWISCARHLGGGLLRLAPEAAVARTRSTSRPSARSEHRADLRRREQRPDRYHRFEG